MVLHLQAQTGPGSMVNVLALLQQQASHKLRCAKQGNLPEAGVVAGVHYKSPTDWVLTRPLWKASQMRSRVGAPSSGELRQ